MDMGNGLKAACVSLALLGSQSGHAVSLTHTINFGGGARDAVASTGFSPHRAGDSGSFVERILLPNFDPGLGLLKEVLVSYDVDLTRAGGLRAIPPQGSSRSAMAMAASGNISVYASLGLSGLGLEPAYTYSSSESLTCTTRYSSSCAQRSNGTTAMDSGVLFASSTASQLVDFLNGTVSLTRSVDTSAAVSGCFGGLSCDAYSYASQTGTVTVEYVYSDVSAEPSMVLPTPTPTPTSTPVSGATGSTGGSVASGSSGSMIDGVLGESTPAPTGRFLRVGRTQPLAMAAPTDIEEQPVFEISLPAAPWLVGISLAMLLWFRRRSVGFSRG
jgi:hypothetical protein